MKIKVLKALAFLCLTASCFGQVSVVLAPIPKFASVTQSGLPNANGCVFTFASGTTNSIPSYTDYTGNTLNQNPVILRPDGTANIWLAAGTVYRFVVKTFGGVNCASGSTVYTVDGIANGSSLNVTAVPFSGTPQFTVLAQNQLFTMTVTGNVVMLPLVATAVQAPAFITFQITQNSVGGYTWTWPANVIGGAPIGLLPNQVTTQEFIWNGTNATAVGPAVVGAGPQMIGVLESGSANMAATGTIRLAATDHICWRDPGGTVDNCISGPIKNTTTVTVGGDTAKHTVYTVPIPGGAMPANGQMRVTITMKNLGTATGTPVVSISYGGSNIASQVIPSTSTGDDGIYLTVLGGNLGGATNSQSWDSLINPVNLDLTPGVTNHLTTAIDSTVSQNLIVSYQGAGVSDNEIFYRIVVEFL